MTLSRVGSPITIALLGALCASGSVIPPTAYAQAADRAVATTVRLAPASPADELLARSVTVNVTRVSLSDAIDAVAASARVLVQYDVHVLDRYATPITLRLKNVSLRTALERTLDGTTLRVIPDGAAQLMITDGRSAVVQATGMIVGHVTDAKTKQPLRGATVRIGTASTDVQTDEDGSFRLGGVAAGTHVVQVRRIGYAAATRTVTVTDNVTTTADVALEPSVKTLDQVVVTGTVVATERKAIPTPITVFTAKDIEERGITRVDQLLRGEVPGVIAMDQGTAGYQPKVGAMVTANVYSRGAAGLYGETNPLKTYVDGVELLDASYLGTLDAKNIERVEIITGPQASTIYGSGATGGVMQIFTKKGAGHSRPDVTLTMKYGLLQTNLSSGRTPAHDHTLSLNGGMGPGFSYSGTLSYNYTGQWQPQYYSRTYGASLGARHTRGPVTVNGSVMVNTGSNGTSGGISIYAADLYGPLGQTMLANGTWTPTSFLSVPRSVSQNVSKSSSQTSAFTVDYTATPFWQHHLTIGRSQNTFDLVPQAPQYVTPSDTLFKFQSQTGQRTTYDYNTTLRPFSGDRLASTLTMGWNGSSGFNTRYEGTALSPDDSYLADPSVNKLYDSWSGGGFGSWQLGLFSHLYLTLGARFERNPDYGRKHKIDVTPTHGITYTVEQGDLTLKLLASYGRATRPPAAWMRKQTIVSVSDYDPAQIISQLEAPNLRPEYERGGQGGFEAYYGNLGSVTLNYYRQRVSDLIQSLVVDSVPVLYLPTGDRYYWQQYQSQNAATIGKHGWDAAATLNVGPVSVKGTYSWDMVKILSYGPQANEYLIYSTSALVQAAPPHLGSLSVRYARGGTSVALYTSYIGGHMKSGNYSLQMWVIPYATRLKMYLDQASGNNPYFFESGYTKSDLSASQRLTDWASLTLNVANVGNSYDSEGSPLYPTLGRRTTLGVSLRAPMTKR